MKHVELKKLQESYERGIITTEEYEKKKKEIDEMPEEKQEESKEEEAKEVKLKSDRTLIIGAIIILLLFGTIFGLRYFKQERPQTIDELHELNFKGKLKKDQGYLYDGVYSFVKFDGLWYAQLVSPKGTRLYNIQFRYGPRDVENIKIRGSLDTNLFNNATEYYVTFNPTGQNFSSVALAVGDFNTHMTNIFFKQPIAACDKNETFACANRPIITCDNTDKLVLYVKEANNSGVYFDNNCMVIEGNGFDLIKGVDRILYGLYEIIQ
ncbi:hypothetical protein HYW19_00935 [Candidatus Woesearchaeota archaeon]|nr:hypothetical protein [Candidatus Woesearchaeota archaeon]